MRTLSLTTIAAADEISGTNSKVGDGARNITVKTEFAVGGSRTTIEGIGSRSDLKVNENVTVEYKGDAAGKIKVVKAK